MEEKIKQYLEGNGFDFMGSEAWGGGDRLIFRKDNIDIFMEIVEHKDELN